MQMRVTVHIHATAIQMKYEDIVLIFLFIIFQICGGSCANSLYSVPQNRMNCYFQFIILIPLQLLHLLLLGILQLIHFLPIALFFSQLILV